ncbi:MAG TPA: NAD(P)H-binding protein [Trebonia sp.]|jgi:uncharacterized protein YbjT (DUF2867 family)|nr:NAD(P)H-binding protein [Trebonia sp.]
MIVVTGATGNVGRLLVQTLTHADHAVTAVARGSSGSLPANSQVFPVTADLTKPATLAPALVGAQSLFLLVPGAGAEVDGSALLAAAAAAGARRVVLLSSQAAGTRPGSISHAPLAAIEDAVRGSGLDWTILRPGGFASNDLSWAGAIKAERVVFAPFGDVALPLVDPADIADVAATVLTSDGHAGRTYVLTGPVPVSPRQRTEILSGVLGFPITFTELSAHQARERMLRFMPPPVADGTLAILGHPTPGERQVNPDVKKVLGRPGRPYAEWAGRNADAFR